MYIVELTTRTLPARKHTALVTHGHYKRILMSWAERHQPLLEQHVLYTTGTIGGLISYATGMNVSMILSGPMGGDQQAGTLISEGKADVLVFFQDPLSVVPHDPDMKALLHLTTVWNIPVATDMATTDFIIQSPHFNSTVDILVPGYRRHPTNRLKQYCTDDRHRLFPTVFSPPAHPDSSVFPQRKRDSLCQTVSIPSGVPGPAPYTLATVLQRPEDPQPVVVAPLP